MTLLDSFKNLFKEKPKGLQVDRQNLIQKIRKLYKFLIDDFGYQLNISTQTDKYPNGPKYYFIKYSNESINRLVEIVLHRNSTVVYRYFKRLENGKEPDYNDNENCISFHQIDFYNGIDDHNRSNPYNPPDYEYAVVKFGKETLLNNIEILKGEKWIDRAKLDELYQLKKGYLTPDGKDPLFSRLITEFNFLTEEFNFEIIHNYNDLPPHEQSLGGSLIYSNKTKVIGLSVDLRDQYFSVYILDFDNYELDSFWQTGKSIYQGSTSDKDIIQAKRRTRNAAEKTVANIG